MASRAPDHQRIRFRARDIAKLDALPSAQRAPAVRGPAANALTVFGRWAARAAVVCVALFFMAAAALYAVGATGLGEGRLRAAAERAIERLAGRDMAAAIGSAKISIDGAHLIGLEVADFGLQAVGQPGRVVEASSLRFGVELLPLLSGDLVLSSASLSGVTIMPAGLGPSGQGDWLEGLRGEGGLLDPDKVPPAAFDALHRAFAALSQGPSGIIDLEDVTVILPEDIGTLRIGAGQVRASGDSSVAFEAHGAIGSRSWTASGSASQEPAGGRVTAMRLALRSPAPVEAARSANSSTAPNRIGDIGLSFAGEEGDGAIASHIEVAAAVGGIAVDLGPNGNVEADLRLSALIAQGAGKVEVSSFLVRMGGSTATLAGAVIPQLSGGGSPTYGWRLAGDETVIAAGGSPEPPLQLGVRAAGSYDPAARRLALDRLGLSGGAGTVTGAGVVDWPAGMTPGVALDLVLAGVPVAEAKQLWPWFAGREAWSWAQRHLRGGTVTEGTLQVRIDPEGIGDDRPLRREEATGSFRLSGTEFDTAGALPAFTRAYGTVAFRGGEVDIALERAEMPLPGGRSLATDRAAMTIRAEPGIPPVGRLDLDLEGDAAAAAELLSLEPIAAMQRMPFGPDDLRGRVRARVTADIPLDRHAAHDALRWKVDAAFSDLGIAKPVEGQVVAGADGKLTADPQGVAVKAAGTLNGIPATLDIAEPFSADGTERRHKISLKLDDKALRTAFPALAGFVSGPVTVAIDASGTERKIEADLRGARLQLPWIGWTKGAGVPATAAFGLRAVDDGAEISDLRIAGESFSAEGEGTLDKNGLRNAHFGSVKLNRDDEIALDIRRDAQGLRVRVAGDAFDARALIKAATAPRSGKDGQGGAAPAVAVEARLARVAGFGGETLRNVALSFQGGGRRALDLTATTDDGGEVSVKDGVEAGRRRIELSTGDAGSLLRFLDLYRNMRGGTMLVALAGKEDALKGSVSGHDFALVDEPRLASLVSARPPGSDRSLGEAVRKPIDTSRATFDRASGDIQKTAGSVTVANGVLRGTTIGAAFQGTLYDGAGRMDMTGTFMPAYGLNRLFGELPLIGVILGNGNDRGLLGVTFKLEGDARAPTVTVNPLSLIAPGIFRRVFEFAD